MRLHHVEPQEGVHVFLSGGPLQCGTISREGDATARRMYGTTIHSNGIAQNRTILTQSSLLNKYTTTLYIFAMEELIKQMQIKKQQPHLFKFTT